MKKANSNAKTYEMRLTGHENQPVYLTTAEAKRHWRRSHHDHEKFKRGQPFEILYMAATVFPLKMCEE